MAKLYIYFDSLRHRAGPALESIGTVVHSEKEMSFKNETTINHKPICFAQRPSHMCYTTIVANIRMKNSDYHSHTFAGVLTFLAAVWCFVGFGLVFGAFFVTIDNLSEACFNSYPFVNGTRAQNDCVTEQGALAIIVIALGLLGIIALIQRLFSWRAT